MSQKQAALIAIRKLAHGFLEHRTPIAAFA